MPIILLIAHSKLAQAVWKHLVHEKYSITLSNIVN